MFTTKQQVKPMYNERLTYDEYKALDLSEQRRYKTVILEDLRDYHQKLIDNLGISRIDFNFKMPFYNKQGVYVVGLFASEFKKEKGLFFELFTRDFTSLEADRKVYNVQNTNFEDEYEVNEKGSYLVPVEELRLVNATSVAISGESAILPNKNLTTSQTQTKSFSNIPVQEDELFSLMTIRDYYAIQKNKAVSLKPWLNELIKSNK